MANRNEDPGTGPALEFLALPYASADNHSLLKVFVDELNRGTWHRFQVAVAFAKASGNCPTLVDALRAFAQADGRVELTFGADTFSGESKGTDLEAVEELVQALGTFGTSSIYLYHEPGRTFHPKIYLFTDKSEKMALLIVGSSNWSEGGMVDNVEASLLVRLTLTNADQRRVYDDVQNCFGQYWRGST